MPNRQIGRALIRLEDARFLRGEGRFVEDIDVGGQLHAVVVRSPHAHARIAGIEAAAASRALHGAAVQAAKTASVNIIDRVRTGILTE